MDLQWYVGIEWGKQQHQICLLDHAGQPCSECMIPHTGEGFLQLTDWLSEHTGAAAPETIGIVWKLPPRGSGMLSSQWL